MRVVDRMHTPPEKVASMFASIVHRSYGLSFRARASLTFVVLLVLLSLLGGTGGGRSGLDGYKLVLPEAGVIKLVVRSTGHVKAKGQLPVFSQVSGLVTAVEADYQVPVRKGDVLAVIDDQDYRMAVQEAELQLSATRSELAGVHARLGNAKQEQARAKRLYKADLIPRQELENADTVMQELNAQLESMEARVQQAEGRLQQAQQDVERCTVRSPIDGVVLASNIEPGVLVARGAAKPMFELAPSLDDLELHVAVTESDIGKVRIGQRATFTTEAYPGEEFQGSVAAIRPGGEERGGVTYYDVVVEAENPAHKLLPRMTTQVHTHAEQQHVDRMIPIKALLFNPDDKVMETWKSEIDEIRQRGDTLVWATDAKHGMRPSGVKLGIQDAEHVQVLSEWTVAEAQVVLGR
jgi:HlyD family secretion protein